MDTSTFAGECHSEPGSSSLIGGIQSQDPEAWARFARVYAPIIYRWARQAGLQANDAADVTQEVFRGVGLSIQHFRREKGRSLSGWLWGITRNKVLDHWRAAGRQPDAAGGTDAHRRFAQLADRSLDEEPEPSRWGSELVRRVTSIIQTDFEERVWQAFWRSAVDRDPTAEIARDLGMTPKAVRQAKYRVLSRLRAELDGELP